MPMNYLLWGYIKNIVYKETINNVEDLKNKLTEAFHSIIAETLHNVRRAYYPNSCLHRMVGISNIY